MTRIGHFTRRARNRRFRGRMSSHQMADQETEENKRIEQLKREQTNPNIEQGTQNHERDRED